MRPDMYKVIVERPRRGGDRRCERPTPSDLEDSPRHESLRSRHRDRKWLNENLAPLRRFLASQVGRPWDTVYAELCAGIDRRNTVQQHIHAHIEQFVAIRVTERDGALYVEHDWRAPMALSETWAPTLYVDPTSGLLRTNTARMAARRALRERTRARLAAERNGHSEVRRVIDARTQLHRIAGLWYRVELAPVAGNEARIDVLRRVAAGDCPQWNDGKRCPSNASLFNTPTHFARSKRQLNARELREHGLTNLS